ncbi:MAG TPA: hypothetical protein VHD56_15880 [Tepidisphaeraceae bacterium]|nr:hypothetical protein [Tepidisphaeraceae bacterium]
MSSTVLNARSMRSRRDAGIADAGSSVMESKPMEGISAVPTALRKQV